MSLPLRSAQSSLASTSAPAPSLTPGELPAVCDPFLTSPGSLASASSDEPRRGASSTSTTVSPFRPVTVTDTISSASRPSSVAAIARSWRAQRPLVEVGARDLQLVADLGRLLEHLLAGERVTQPVLDHRVERLDITHAEALAGTRQQVRRLRHRLHAAADRDLEVPGADGLVDHADGAHAGGTHLVDRLRGDLDRDAGLDLRLAAGDLPLRGLQHRAHDDVLDLLGRDVGALQRLADRYAAEMRGRERRQTPAQLADRRARAAQDHGSRHTASLLTCGRCTSQRPLTHRPPRAPTRSSSASSRTRGSPTITAASCRRWSTPARPGARCASSRSPTPRASATSSPGWARVRASIPRRRGSSPRGSLVARAGARHQRVVLGSAPPRLRRPCRRARRGHAAGGLQLPRVQGRDDDGGLEALLLSAHHDVGARGRAGRHRGRRDQPRPRPPEPPGERAHAERAGRVRPGAGGRRGGRHGRRGDRGRGHGRLRLRRPGLLRGRAADHAALRAGRRHRPAARASSARP